MRSVKKSGGVVTNYNAWDVADTLAGKALRNLITPKEASKDLGFVLTISGVHLGNFEPRNHGTNTLDYLPNFEPSNRGSDAFDHADPTHVGPDDIFDFGNPARAVDQIRLAAKNLYAKYGPDILASGHPAAALLRSAAKNLYAKYGPDIFDRPEHDLRDDLNFKSRHKPRP